MPSTKMPSPARSESALGTSKQQNFRASRSVGSPARSDTSAKLSSIIREHKMDSYFLSPLKTRMSVLSDNTNINEPKRKSWWKRLEDNSRDAIEIFNQKQSEEVENVEELYDDIETLSQEKRDYTSLPEVSDSESMESIKVPQRKLFTQKDADAQKLFSKVIDTRDDLAQLHKSKSAHDKTNITNVGKKNLLNRGTREQTKPVFPAALLNISVNETLPNKTKESVKQDQARRLFGRQSNTKRTNIFAEFILSESEDETSDIQPKIFKFPNNNEQQGQKSSPKRVTGNNFRTSDAIDLEIDDWKLLPSSTMIDNQFGIIDESTPAKRARLSNKSKNKSIKVASCYDRRQSEEININNAEQSQQVDKEKSNVTQKLNLEHDKSLKGKCLKHVQNDEDENDFTLQYENDDENQNIEDDQRTLLRNKSNSSISPTKLSHSLRSSNIVTNKLESQKNVTAPISHKANEKQSNEEILNHSNEKNTMNDVPKPSINKSNINCQHDLNIPQKDREGEIMNRSKIKDINSSKDILSNDKDANIDCDEVKSSNALNCQNGHEENEKEDDTKNILQDEHQNNLEESYVSQNSSKREETEEDINEDDSIGEHISDNEEENQDVEEEENIHDSDEDNADENQDDNDEENYEQNLEGNHEESDIELENNFDKKDDDENNEGREESEKSNFRIEEQNKEPDQNKIQTDEHVIQNEKERYQNEDNFQNSDIDHNEVENEHPGFKCTEEIEDPVSNNKEKTQKRLDVSDDLETKNKSQSKNKTLEKSSHQTEKPEGTKDSNQTRRVTLNTTHDRTGKNRQRIELEMKSPEEILNYVPNVMDSFSAKGRNTSIRKTKSIIKFNNIKPSLAPLRESTGISNDGSYNSSAERSGWDSHRTTRKTLRQTFGKDFTPRKSLRALVMEKSAKRQTYGHDVTVKVPQACSTKLPETMDAEMSEDDSANDSESNNNYHNSYERNEPEQTNSDVENENDEETTKENFERHNSDSEINQNDEEYTEECTEENSEKSNSDSEVIQSDEETAEESSGRHNYTSKNESEQRYSTNSDMPGRSSDMTDVDVTEESDHEASRMRRKAAFKMDLQRMIKENLEKNRKMEEAIRNSLKQPPKSPFNYFKVPARPYVAPRRINIKAGEVTTKKKEIKSSIIPLQSLPREVLEDMKYKPPRRYQPKNAPWVTKRLYKYLEAKLEPKYDYKARVRAEKLVETIYNFTKTTGRHQVAPVDAVDVLKLEMARLNVVKTHFEFYEFFRDFMPRGVRIKVIPDVVNDIPLPKHGVFSDIIR